MTLRSDAVALSQRYATEVTGDAKALKAKAIQDCDQIGNIQSIDDEIRLINAQIADKVIFRSTKYESYWSQLEID